MRAQRQKLVPLILLNLFLVIVLFFILEQTGIFSWRKLFRLSKETLTPKAVIEEDPYLLEKEELRKQWQVLAEKERLYKERLEEYNKNEKLLKEKLKEADSQIKIAKEMQKKQEELKKQWEDRQANVRILANKIGNMPPKDGVALLEKMEPTLAVDVIRDMDRLAEERGKKSITDYLLSIMDKQKASNIIRMISKYPKKPEEEKETPEKKEEATP